MKRIGIIKIGMFLLLSALVGCGGGGGGGGSAPPTDPNPPAQTNKISGVASKGPIVGGTVTAYKIVNNTKGALIVSGITAVDGTYSLDLGTYSGPVLLEISGGTYTDEATGISKPGTTLHAAVPNASGTISAAITPFTELAYQLAGPATLTSAVINSSNKRVADAFKLYDIINVLPVAPTKSVLDALPTTVQGQDRRDYTLALAAFSQVAKDKSLTVADTVTYFANNITASALSTPAATAVQNAATAFFRPQTINTNNKTGVTDPAATNLVYIGAKKATVILSTEGTLPNGNSIKGMGFELILPAGVSVKSDVNGVLASYLLASGMASNTTSMLTGNIAGTKLSVSFVNNTGITTGEFATLICDVAYDAAAPTVGDFSISSGYKVSDLILNGGTLNLSSAIKIVVSSVTVK